MMRASNVSPVITLNRLARDAGLEVAGPAPRGALDGEVRDVHEDSRRCGPGDVFVARPGARDDGLRWAADAVRRGAVAVVAASDPRAGVPWLKAADPAEAAGRLADLVHDDPSRKLALLGVTGTNGKTSVVELAAHLLAPDGPVGVIGTLGARWPGAETKTANTTPGATELRRILRGMVDAGCRACAMEVSSHALVQGRVDGLRFRTAAYTNLSGDHLDYHGSMEHYAAAKARLFAALAPDATAVVNARDTVAATVATAARRVAFDAGSVRVAPEGTAFSWRGRDAFVPLVGRHNAENAACALELACAAGVAPDDALARLRDARPARGRLEPVQRKPFLVAVDYAHTDDALENVLRTVREVTPGRVRVVFGCGGDRDRTKRPRMGAVAAAGADDVVVTSDNPRSEQPERIVADVLQGIRERDVRVLLDRRTAIREAIASARPGDAVVIAGKGHEAVQIVGEREIPFDDASEARAALAQSRAGRPEGPSGEQEPGFAVARRPASPDPPARRPAEGPPDRANPKISK